MTNFREKEDDPGVYWAQKANRAILLGLGKRLFLEVGDGELDPDSLDEALCETKNPVTKQNL